MKNYLKKVFYFALIFTVSDLFTNNLLFFPNDKFGVRFVLDGWTLILIIGYFLVSFIHVGIIKFVSRKVDKFIYKSNKMIIYIALVYQSCGGLEILLLSPIRGYDFSSFLIVSTYFIVSILVIYYFWKYRMEIVVGVFLSNVIILKTPLIETNKNGLLARWFKYYLNINQISNFTKGIIVSIGLAIFLAITIFLRKKGVYDYRSEQEQWQEKVREGYYTRFKDLK